MDCVRCWLLAGAELAAFPHCGPRLWAWCAQNEDGRLTREEFKAGARKDPSIMQALNLCRPAGITLSLASTMRVLRPVCCRRRPHVSGAILLKPRGCFCFGLGPFWMCVWSLALLGRPQLKPWGAFLFFSWAIWLRRRGEEGGKGRGRGLDRKAQAD
jgi:hypothetical protein